tara:strand:+ start:1357 stop:1500 length:144 start_codon:yes stop_codon:yes gene_type:complete
MIFYNENKVLQDIHVCARLTTFAHKSATCADMVRAQNSRMQMKIWEI